MGLIGLSQPGLGGDAGCSRSGVHCYHGYRRALRGDRNTYALESTSRNP